MLKHPKIPHENAFELLLIGFHPMFAIKHEALLSLLSLSLSLSPRHWLDHILWITMGLQWTLKGYLSIYP